MRKNFSTLVLFILGLLVLSGGVLAQKKIPPKMSNLTGGVPAKVSGGTCATSDPICTSGAAVTYPAGVNSGNGEAGPNYGCLGSQPNPAWFYLKIGVAGDIHILETNSNNKDVDFCLWGPFANQADAQNAANMTAGKIIDCSFAPAANENIDIAVSNVGEYYTLLVTNFSNQATQIQLDKTGGAGDTDCAIVNPVPPAPVNGASTNITSSSFDANWNASAGATGYFLDVATDAAFTAFVAGFNNRDVGNVLTFNVPGLLSSTNYYSRLRAYNVNGTSGNSGTTTTLTAPVPPVNGASTNITITSFDANWAASAGATGYRLDVATDAAFTAFVAGFNNRDVGNVTTCNVAGLAGGTNYFSRVRAYNGGGTSGNSGTTTTLTIPAAPINGASTGITNSSFDANWAASAGATGYFLDVATDVAFTTFVAGFNNRDVGNVTTFNVPGLNSATNYYSRVRAYNGSGTSGNSGTTTTLTLPNPPTFPSPAATNITTTSFQANWNASPGIIGGYRLDVAEDAAFTIFLAGHNNRDVGNVTSFVVNGITACTRYYWRLRAYNASGTSANSTVNQVRSIPLPPIFPQSPATSITATQTTITLYWDASICATGYFLDVATDHLFTNNSIVSGYNNRDVGNVTTYTATLLSPGTLYHLRLRAYNESGTSDNSLLKAIETLTYPPASMTATNITTTSFTANWSASQGASGYYLDIATDAGFTNFVPGFNNLHIFGGLTTSQNITGLTPNTNYFGRVRSHNVTNNISNNSPVLNVITQPVDAPILANPAITDITSFGYTAHWNPVVGATGYLFDLSTDPNFGTFVPGYNNLDVGNVTAFSPTGLNPNTLYYFRVRAYNANGAGQNSVSASATTSPAAPTLASPSVINITAFGFTARWNAVAGATGYNFDLSTDPNFGTFVTGYNNLDVGNVLQLVIGGLNPNTPYYFRIRAYGPNGTSPNSLVGQATTLPGAPTLADPSVTNITSFGFTANWNAVPGATGYFFDLATDAGFVNFVAGYNNRDVGNVLTQTITGLNPNTPYFFRIRAYGPNGTGPNSVIGQATTAPGAPQLANPSATNITNTGFTANWLAVAGATGYYFDLSTDPNFGTFVTGYNNQDVGNVLTQTITGLNPGVNYYFRVRAYSPNGTGPNSAVGTATTTPGGPTWASPSVINITTNGFTVIWNIVPGATGYFFDLSRQPDFSTLVPDYNNRNVGNTNFLTMTDLNPNTLYYFRIRAFNASGVSANSTPGSATTAPNAPVLANPSVTNITPYSFTANWQPVDGATGYNFDLSTDPNFGTFITGYNNRDVGNVTTYTVSGLTPGVQYYFRIRAYNQSGAGSNSTTGSATTSSGAPTLASPSVTNITSFSFTANWNAVPGATGYYFDLSTNSGFTSFVSGYNNKDVGNVLTYTVANLNPNTAYFFRVRSYGPGGTSTNSAIGSATTTIGAPQLANPSVTDITSSSFIAHWIDVGGAYGYYFDLSTDPNFATFVTGYNNKDVGNITSYMVTGLNPNTLYYFRVRAYDLVATGSNSATGQALTTAGTPTLANPSAINITPLSFTAVWNAVAGAIGYYFDLATDASFVNFVAGYNNKNVGNVTSYTVTGLIPKMQYYFRVRAYNSSGPGNNSSSFGVLTLANVAAILINIEPNTLTYTTKQSTVTVSNTIEVRDNIHPALASATISIASGYIPAQDLLVFTNQNGINGTWDPISGSMLLKGNATPQQYQAALRTIQYKNILSNPTLTDRTISYTVNDGYDNSNLQSRTIRFLITSIENLSLGIPTNYELNQNYPNPFNPNTRIRFALPKESNVRVSVYSVLGEEIARLVEGVYDAGYYEVDFNGSKFSSGIYYYRIDAGYFVQVKKMLLVK